MALVSGRPISFQMDLYQPLYVPRPVVEPELFASLRPPTYQGAMDTQRRRGCGDAGEQLQKQMAGLAGPRAKARRRKWPTNTARFGPPTSRTPWD